MINNTLKCMLIAIFMQRSLQLTTITSKRYKSKDLLVPRAGIEPARLAARDFESRASTNSATWACLEYTLLYICDFAIIASYLFYENPRLRFLCIIAVNNYPTPGLFAGPASIQGLPVDAFAMPGSALTY